MTTTKEEVPSVPADRESGEHIVSSRNARTEYTEAERRVLRSADGARSYGVHYGKEAAASLGDLAHGLCGPGCDEPIARNALRALSKEIYVWCQAIKSDEVRDINPDILSDALYAMHLRAEAAAELDERFERAGVYRKDAEDAKEVTS